MYVLRTYIQPGECNFVNFLIKHSMSIDTHTGVPSTELIHLFIRLSGSQPGELSPDNRTLMVVGVQGASNISFSSTVCCCCLLSCVIIKPTLDVGTVMCAVLH